MRRLHPAAPIALAAAALAGCAAGTGTAPGAAAPIAMSAATLDKLATHQASDIFGVIGRPDATEKTDKGSVYTWQAKVSSSVWVPTPSMTAGFISSMPAGMDNSGSSGQAYDHEVVCRLRVDAGATGLIEHLDFHGPHSACDPVSRRLATWVNGAAG